ncbi:MAG TPA: PfkB family carbohydrate kinase [Actinomycetota bacterium]|nr:PfkB family carbohydrate kinase [Actinomycetota bacterium]
MFDVAVVGSPFLDLTFEGLPRLPRIGEELTADALHITPGGTGMHSIAAARLGMKTALGAPVGDWGGAAIVRSALLSEGVHIHPETPGASGHALPTTALLATPQGVAMATVLGPPETETEAFAEIRARAVLLSLGRLNLAPPTGDVYVVTGGLELESLQEDAFEKLGRARALIVNAEEAAALTGYRDPQEAALDLCRHLPTAIVTMSSEGAIEATGGAAIAGNAPRVEVVDATGAGDLFAAAYLWADLHKSSPSDRLAWASLYAGLSVREPTALAGALRLSEFLVEGAARGLTRPPALDVR